MAVNLDDLVAVNMAALILSITLWGLYVCLSIVMVLVLRQRRTWLASLPVYCTVVIFVCNLGDTTCVVFTASKGLFFYPQGKLLYFIRYYHRTIDHGWYAATSVLRCTAGFTAAVLILWRVFVIWSRDKRVLYLPIVLMSLGFIGCTLILVYDICNAPNFSKDPAVLAQYNHITVAVLAVDIINTWYCTGLICYRLFSVLRQKQATADVLNDLETDMDSGSPYRKIIRVLIQSGMLYSVAEAAFLICVLTSSGNGKYIMNYLISRITGIATVLIIIQLNTAPPRGNVRGNLQQPQSGESESFSMPVFRNLGKDQSTTYEVDTKGISQSSTLEDSIDQTTSYVVPYGGQSHKQSSAYEDSIEHAPSHLAPYGGQSHNPSSSTVAGYDTA